MFKFCQNYKKELGDMTLAEMETGLREIEMNIKKFLYIASEDENSYAVMEKNETTMRENINMAGNYCDIENFQKNQLRKLDTETLKKLEKIVEERKCTMKKTKTKEVEIETGEMKENNPDTKVEEREKQQPVSKPESMVELLIKENFKIVMIALYKKESLVVDNCKIVPVDIDTGIPLIGAGAGIEISKRKVLDANDYTVLNVIKGFAFIFSDDDIKIAYDNAITFLGKCDKSNMAGYNSSANIIDVYREVIRQGVAEDEREKNMKAKKEERNCILDKQHNRIDIRDKFLKEILEEANYMPGRFCKRLIEAEIIIGEKMLERYPGGRYSINKTGNRRFYTFFVIDKLVNGGEVK